VQTDVILDDGSEKRRGDAEAHRPGGEINIDLVLGAGGVGLRPAKRPKALQLIQALATQEIFDRVQHWRGVRLDRNPVLGA
jgi:hypothetical protein